MKRARLAAALVLAAALLAGCSEIPTTGPVQAGATQEPNGTTIEYLPNPPASGASRQEIVNGFLAAASAGGTFAVAKQYLTTAFAERWKPLSRVLVQGEQPQTTTGGSGDITLTVPITAEVSSAGVYTPSTKSQRLSFHLVQQNGQWRIDRADDGIVLLPTAFQRFYRPFAIQFFDQTWTRLVPDLRWFFVPPSSAGSAPSSRSIVDQLIAGPVGAVSGTGVTVNALAGATVQSITPSTADVTTVTLTVPQSDPSPELAARMQQQLIQSLKLPTPGSLRLVLNNQVVPAVKSLLSQSPLPVAYVVSGSAFGQLSATGTFTADPTLGKRIVALHPQAVTVSVRQGIAAVLTPSNQVAVTTASTTTVVDPRPGLIPPTMDQRGWVYSVPADSPSGMQAADGKGGVVNLFANLPGTSINAIEASPDGTRMLVLVTTSAGPEAFVAGIERNADGSPTGLTPASSRYPVDLGGNTGTGIGATWVDDSSVAVLVEAPGNSTDRVQVQQLGGTASALADLPGATAIVGTTDPSDLRILLANGQLFVSNDESWHQESSSAPKVSVLAVQR